MQHGQTRKRIFQKALASLRNLDGLEMRAKNVGRAAAGWDSREFFFGLEKSCLGNALLHSTRSVSPPAFHSRRFPRFAPRWFFPIVLRAKAVKGCDAEQEQKQIKYYGGSDMSLRKDD